MKIPQDPSKKESIESFREWWHTRIHTKNGTAYVMPDFFEVWDARQEEIDRLKKENEELKSKIASLEASK